VVGGKVGFGCEGKGYMGRERMRENLTIFNLYSISCIVRMYVCCGYRNSALHDGYE
jgi:hypothetical protein